MLHKSLSVPLQPDFSLISKFFSKRSHDSRVWLSEVVSLSACSQAGRGRPTLHFTRPNPHDCSSFKANLLHLLSALQDQFHHPSIYIYPSIHSIIAFLMWCIISRAPQCCGALVEPGPPRILLSPRCSFYPPALWVFSQCSCLSPTLPFTSAFCFICLLLTLPVVMTPSSRMMLVWSNCPRMPASQRKERRCLSEQPARNVFMATGSSLLLGSFRQPRQTSPKSPVKWEQKGSQAPLINLQRKSSLTITGDR